MRVLILGLAFCAIGNIAVGQTRMPDAATFDHQALFVRDLETSVQFYSEILFLSEIENKTKNPAVRWLSLGNGIQLHLISGDNEEIALKKAVHFALAVSDFDEFVKHLDERNIDYADWPGEKHSPSLRADGVRQVYLQDPDGYWIEINDAKHERSTLRCRCVLAVLGIQLPTARYGNMMDVAI